MTYGSPAPQPRTDLHRYVILLFEHQGRRLTVPTIKQRAKFSVKQFMEKHNLGKVIPLFSCLLLLFFKQKKEYLFLLYRHYGDICYGPVAVAAYLCIIH